ncbi:GyrI-like domain-containing protein [Methanobacterium alcaliphilum]|uniref:GyrI-like domain-containing protein n=1 Tax=Methanobacterium alcaliphilum TaxID=392018 RepID=UPI00200B2EE7|nr:GyrI-like domain-containing protein [Methanobacterium alcaliphilum]MCK9150453.1 GyrI-like domain-containing protein [Methanobacterium alcaliphilum]
MKIEIKKIPEYQTAYIFYKGSYEKIPEILGSVVGWLMEKNVEIQMPVYGTYFNSPLEVSEEELEWEMGASFNGKLKAEDNIQIKTVPEQTVVSTIFKGPYGEASSVYVDLFEYAEKEGYQIFGPVTEIYMNSPEFVPESELLTEVQFPVSKK